MSNNASKIKEAIRAIAGTVPGNDIFVIGQVVSANEESCSVDVDGMILTDVRTGAVIDGEKSSLKIKPAVGCNVLMADLSGGELRDMAVVSFSRIDSITINAGNLGGLVNVAPLTNKINALENDLNALKKAFGAWTAVPNDGGAALKGLTTTWASQPLITTVRADIEDTKIKH